MILEIYCNCEEMKEDLPCYSIFKTNELGLHCFESQCEFLSYTSSPNEIAYSGNTGVVQGIDDFIGFGGEMDVNTENRYYDKTRDKLIDKWKGICKNKISESYDEYMKEISE